MTEPTIEELVEQLMRDTKYYQFVSTTNPENAKTYESCMIASRSALLSRIASLQTEADAWHKMADEWKEDAERMAFLAQVECEDDAKDMDKHNALTARYSHEKEGEG